MCVCAMLHERLPPAIPCCACSITQGWLYPRAHVYIDLIILDPDKSDSAHFNTLFHAYPSMCSAELMCNGLSPCVINRAHAQLAELVLTGWGPSGMPSELPAVLLLNSTHLPSQISPTYCFSRDRCMLSSKAAFRSRGSCNCGPFLPNKAGGS